MDKYRNLLLLTYYTKKDLQQGKKQDAMFNLDRIFEELENIIQREDEDLTYAVKHNQEHKELIEWIKTKLQEKEDE